MFFMLTLLVRGGKSDDFGLTLGRKSWARKGQLDEPNKLI